MSALIIYRRPVAGAVLLRSAMTRITNWILSLQETSIMVGGICREWIIKRTRHLSCDNVGEVEKFGFNVDNTKPLPDF